MGAMERTTDHGLSLDALNQAFVEMLGRGHVPYADSPGSGDAAAAENAATEADIEVAPRNIVEAMLFVGLPWIIFHYITKWKTAATLTNEDEAMLEQMLDTARRLEDRLSTIERIVAADNPDFRPVRPSATDEEYDYQRRN